MRKTYFLLSVASLFGIGILFISCASESINQNKGMKYWKYWTQREYNLKDQEILNIQFYLSCEGGLVFRRTSDRHTDEKQFAAGIPSNLRTTFRQNDKIVIPDGTPGVCVKVQSSHYYIDFGEGIILSFFSVGGNSYWCQTDYFEGYKAENNENAFLQYNPGTLTHRLIEQNNEKIIKGRTL